MKKSFDINKVVMALFLIGILSTTFSNQNLNNRRRVNLTAFITNSQTDCSETKKQIPVLPNTFAEEEEDKIVEETDCICTEHCPILITLSFSFSMTIFEEPYLKVITLPPWA